MRTLIISLTALVFASAAGAATLAVVSDKAVYSPGEVITLTLFGNSEGEVSSTYSLIGRLVYHPALLDPVSVGTATHPGGGWVDGGASQGDGFVELFNFADFSFSGSSPNYNGNTVINTATLIARAGGVVDLSWTDSLSFFGIQGAQPATSFVVFPEPATGALLGLGLLWLAQPKRRKP